MPEKSKVTSGVMYSMSKATICCLRMRRCFRRKSCESICVAELRSMEEARWREMVVWWTIVWARSSKTVDYKRRLDISCSRDKYTYVD